MPETADRPNQRLNPVAASVERARARVLTVIRAVGDIDPPSAGAPFVLADPGRLEGFRRLLALRESEANAMERMAEIITIFDPAIQSRFAQVADSGAGRRYRSVRHWLASHSYRQVHSAALGVGAATMWSFGEPPEGVWLHGTATGMLMAHACHDDPVLRDRAFAAGLLHNIGRMALLQSGAPATSSRPDLAQEPVYVEATGRAVLREIEVPAYLSDTSIPCDLPRNEGTQLARLTSAACYLAHEFRFVDSTVADPRRTPDGQAVKQVASAVIDAGGRERIAADVASTLIASESGRAGSAIGVA